MTYHSGQIVMVPFPYVDVDHVKTRPAIIVSPDSFHQETNQYWLLMITTAKQSGWTQDYPIQYWKESGLKLPCRVRLKAVTLAGEQIYKIIGTLHRDDWRNIKSKLLDFFAEVN